MISLTHASMDSDNHPISLCLLCSQSPPKAYNVLRTFHSPSESISPMDIRFCFVVPAQLPNPLRVLSKTQPWGWSYGLWAIGYRLGYAACRYPCLSPLTFHLIAHSLPKAVFWRRYQRQMYERYEVARVKTDSPFGRTSYVRPKGERFEERFGEHLK